MPNACRADMSAVPLRTIWVRGLSGIAFRANEAGLDEVLLLPNPPFVHVAGRLKLDTWNDRPKINLQVSDLATL